jgi:MFS family permease
LAALAPKNRFGAVYGMDTSITAAANAAAPMVGAALTATWGLSAAFLGAAVMYGLATVVVGTAVPGVKARQEQERTAG